MQIPCHRRHLFEGGGVDCPIESSTAVSQNRPSLATDTRFTPDTQRKQCQPLGCPQSPSHRALSLQGPTGSNSLSRGRSKGRQPRPPKGPLDHSPPGSAARRMWRAVISEITARRLLIFLQNIQPSAAAVYTVKRACLPKVHVQEACQRCGLTVTSSGALDLKTKV